MTTVLNYKAMVQIPRIDRHIKDVFQGKVFFSKRQKGAVNKETDDKEFNNYKCISV